MDRYAERIKTCYYRLIVFSLLSLFFIPNSVARNDSIYGGTIVKLDIASPIVVAGTHQWKMQHYEIAANVRLAKRFYPTLELGYAGGQSSRGDTLLYRGQGGFFRVGADISPFKKHPNSPHALLVGVRLGTAIQDIRQENTRAAALPYYGVRADCWGEIVLGCQVEIARLKHHLPTADHRPPMAFYMGWMGRLKALFTRDNSTDRIEQLRAPIYIPGFGARDNIGWGVNYYLGWRF